MSLCITPLYSMHMSNQLDFHFVRSCVCMIVYHCISLGWATAPPHMVAHTPHPRSKFFATPSIGSRNQLLLYSWITRVHYYCKSIDFYPTMTTSTSEKPGNVKRIHQILQSTEICIWPWFSHQCLPFFLNLHWYGQLISFESKLK